MRQYGIWNSVEKRFVFGIKANSREEAERQFKQKAGIDAWRKWRYESKVIPPGNVNPKRKVAEKESGT